ncbi:MAG TPA: ATP-binding cassette domain-containing protein [Solirubrobacterales bacterium]|jgi:iron complex transport system ATP-binding protein|nr:ATP-binding cassette domain-containing protein [Solirubrobacterales bacterium]
MAAIRMTEVNVWRWVAAEERRAVLLHGVNWTVERGEHWVVLGPNGAGKTTLLSMAAAFSHPSEGTVEVLGQTLGAVDMRTLRESIGTLEPALSRRIQGRYSGYEVVLTGATGSIALLHDRVTDEDRARADRLMGEIGVEPLRDRRFEDCSQGERQRLLLARSLMDEPQLLLLDEPTTGLDLPSRERLIASLDTMAEANGDLPTVIVTHHLEEIPSTTTHALLLRDGAIVAAGQVGAVLTSEAVSETFDIEVQVAHNTGRWAAMVVRS